MLMCVNSPTLPLRKPLFDWVLDHFLFTILGGFVDVLRMQDAKSKH